MKSLNDSQFWQPIIENARDIVKIDICVVDSNNNPVFLSHSDNHYGSNWSHVHFSVRSTFKELGYGRWEYVDPYGFYFYALEVKNDSRVVIGFIVIGPVILSKRLVVEEYRRLLERSGENSDKFFERLEEIRCISHINLDGILNTIEALLAVSEGKEAVLSPVSTHYEGILNSIFQVLLAMSNAESGSLMIFDEPSNKLLICTAKGIQTEYLRFQVGLNDSVSGRAFQEQKSYILKGRSEPELPKQFLSRNEIRESIVMPFGGDKGRFRGVLNLNYINKLSVDITDTKRRVERVLGDVLSNL